VASSDGAGHFPNLFSELTSRGIVELQARRLLNDRGVAELEKIAQILPYYDYLVATEDRKISRNPVGFLYRAVERPEQFQIPKSFLKVKTANASPGFAKQGFANRSPAQEQAGSVDPREYQRNPRGRPDLKIFTGAKQDSAVEQGLKANSELEKEYQNYCNSEFQRVLAELEPSVLAEIYHNVEQKTQLLSGALGPEVLQKTVEGCVRKDVLHRAQVPSFKAWIKLKVDCSD